MVKKRDLEIFKEIKHFLDSTLEENIPIKDLCIKFGINRNKLQTAFKILFGQTIHTYILEQKMKKASERLRATADPIKVIALGIGYSSGNFTTKFRRHYGCSPHQFRQRKTSGNGIQ